MVGRKDSVLLYTLISAPDCSLCSVMVLDIMVREMYLKTALRLSTYKSIYSLPLLVSLVLYYV